MMIYMIVQQGIAYHLFQDRSSTNKFLSWFRERKFASNVSVLTLSEEAQMTGPFLVTWCNTFYRVLQWKREESQTDQWTHCYILSYQHYSMRSIVSPCIWLPWFQHQRDIWWHIWVWTVECSVCIWCCSSWWMELLHLIKEIVIGKIFKL